MEGYEEAQINDVRTFTTWITIILGSLMISSAVMFWNPGVTGLLSYDTGPAVDFNPDLITISDYSSHLTNSLFFIAMIIILQVLIYVGVARFYKNIENT